MSSPRGPRTRSRILYHKENNPAEAQAGMRQHTVARTKRQPLASTPPPPEEPMVFAGREDVVALLSENMKGKNKEMQEYIKKLRACVKWLLEREDAILAETEKTHGLLDKLVAGNAKLENSVENTESQNEEIQKQHQSLQQRLEMLEAEKTDALRALKDEKEARAAMEKRLYDQNDLLNEVKGLRMYLQHSREDRDTNSAQETDSSQREIIKTLEIKLADADEKLKLSLSRLEEAKQQIVDGEKQRKKLHETILELKGKIRVFCRVRPLQSNEPGVVSYPKIGENFGRGIELMHNAQVYSFTFDKVFDDRASQQNVFIEVSELIQSALDGCKVSIFAYGQTGSGKTYTMMGDPTSDDKKGLIPRSLEQIFQASQTLNTQGWKYKIQVSVLEIYKKDIKDLLVTDRQDGVSRYEIYHDDNGNTVVSDLTIVDVTCTNEVSSLLRLANRSRSVGQTKMNEESSRSHLVFTVRIFGGNEGTGQQVQGIVNLIDLAGCERLEKSGATDDRLKETMAINKSLSCLSEVMLQISKKEEHVSFRNSTLTYLLQPCLSGSGKTLMLVNLSPEVSSSGETICSLRFAARVKSCEINAPHPQTQLHNPGSKAAAPSFAKCTAPPSPALRALLPLGANLSFPPPTPPPPLTHGPHQWKSPPFAPRTLPGHSGEQRWSRKNEAKDSGKVGNHKEQRLEFQEV